MLLFGGSCRVDRRLCGRVRIFCCFFDFTLFTYLEYSGSSYWVGVGILF